MTAALDLAAIERDRAFAVGRWAFAPTEALRLAVVHVPALVAEVRRMELERDAAVAAFLGPRCEACDSETATNVTPDGFRGCDDHRSPGSVDLPYAAALRRLVADGGYVEPGGGA